MQERAKPIWVPSRERVEGSHLYRFAQAVEMAYGPGLLGYAGLHAWSVHAPEDFWACVWEFCEVRASRTWERVLEPGRAMWEARWFPGARLNFAENLLRRDSEVPALIALTEDGRRTTLSHVELRAEVRRVAAFLAEVGVGPGDRVAGYLPNGVEAVVAMLAATRIGAVWSSCSPDFGVAAALDRFRQIAPRVLFAADGYRYAGRRRATLGRAADLAARLPGLERVVVVPFLEARPDLSGVPGALAYECLPGGADPPEYAQLAFDHPVYILYSSGTTGAPKCIVHGAGGTLLQHLKELVLHTDLHPGDRLFYHTTCGWMMWNWLVSALAAGASVVLYDGSPLHPGPERLFRLAAEEGVDVFGTSARHLSAVEQAGARPGATHDLSALRTVLSTGSPLLPESYDYVYREVGSDLCLASISGGTDILSCFALGNPLLPVYRGELQCLGLGMDVDVFDAAGRSRVGEKGELVCRSPFPSMPLGLWNDPGGRRYRRAYFERYPGAWTHGDYAERTRHGGLVIHGRSDTVLNPGGVRIGTAEIYRPLHADPDVEEALAVGQAWRGDTRVVLFVRLREGVRLDAAKTRALKARVREAASPRHVPAVIVQVADLPRTVNGKLAEVAVRETIHGRAVSNRAALANPESLELFAGLAVLADSA